jgi:hypothetical protein
VVTVTGKESFPLNVAVGVIVSAPFNTMALATPITDVGEPDAITTTLDDVNPGIGTVVDSAPSTWAMIVLGVGVGVGVGVPVGIGVPVGVGVGVGRAGAVIEKLMVKLVVTPKSSVTETTEVKSPASDGVPLMVAVDVPDVKISPVGSEVTLQFE